MKNLNLDKFRQILKMFPQQEIMVVGDIMLDRYITGHVERISPEAPVPVLDVTGEKSVPGGAANVAVNLSKLHSKTYVAGITGRDEAGEELRGLLQRMQINDELVIANESKNTIQKVRVIGEHQQLLRIDYENNSYISNSLENTILQGISQRDLRAIILSDYAKGTLTGRLIRELVEWGKEKNLPVVIDPKPQHKEYYKGCFLLKPNRKEAQEMTGIEIRDKSSLERCGLHLAQDCNCRVIITLGEDGMAVFSTEEEMLHIPTRAQEVFDVSGAGDTVAAVLTLAIVSGASLAEAAELANIAGGIKVAKMGTHPVELEEISEFLDTAK